MQGSKTRRNVVTPFRLEPPSYLMESHEEAVDVISGRAGIERVLVFLYLFHRKASHLLNFSEHFVVSARQPFHQPRKHVVHLRKGSGEERVNIWQISDRDASRCSIADIRGPFWLLTCPRALLPNCMTSEMMCRRLRNCSLS